MSDRFKALADAGVSIWLDDLSRERIETGNLADLVKEKSVIGVTTNPTIFAAAHRRGRALRRAGPTCWRDKARARGRGCVFELTTDDVRNACDILAPDLRRHQRRRRPGLDRGRARIWPTTPRPPSPQARELWTVVDRPNVLIKIPATKAGLPPITAAIAEGISVNVTLIFALERYREVMDAYLTGLEQAREAGHDLSQIQSVASFFVSRVDTEIDKRLDALQGAAPTRPRRSRARRRSPTPGSRTPRTRRSSAASGGRAWPRPAPTRSGRCGRRPASRTRTTPTRCTSTDLVVADTVNTMPEKTMEAFADHGEVRGDTVTGRAAEAQGVFDALAGVGIDFDDVLLVLEHEGVDKFKKSWDELVETVSGQMEKAGQGQA